MLDADSANLEIFEVGPRERAAALAAVLGPAHARTNRYQEHSSGAVPELILGYRGDGSKITNALMMRRYPGRTAMIMVSAARTKLDAYRGSALIARSIACGSRVGAVLVQALVEPLRSDDVAMFEGGGMRSIGTLAYLERTSAGRVAAPAHRAGVTIRSWSPGERAMMENLLEATYIDSLDCPGLAQMRTTSDILDGHMQTGRMDARTWFILEVDSEPQGVALLSEIPASNCAEIVYFGLSPQARGRGLGALLLDHTINAAEEMHASQVVLACDERNEVAMRLYQSRGFAMRLRRRALVAPVKSA